MDDSRDATAYEHADLALLLSALAWGFPEPTTSSGSPWRRLDRGWEERVREASGDRDPPSPAEALSLLRQSLRFQCRANLEEVHPSWWIRAIQDESPAVRLLIASQAPPRVAAAARAAFGVRADDMKRLPPPEPDVAGWVLALWTERLVGDEPVQRNDLPVLVALSGLSPFGLYRLSQEIGLAKVVLAGDPDALIGGLANWRPRGDCYRDLFLQQYGPQETGPRARAMRDLQEVVSLQGMTDRRLLAILGLTTLARLLVSAEAYRVRWALQHIPYPVAKRIRSLMTRNPTIGSNLRHTESMILKAARDRLTLEGRLTLLHPEKSRSPGDAP